MKLGIETGSVMNHLMARSVIGEPEPVVGMGATILMWTDRQPATITQVTTFDGSSLWQYQIEVQEDRYQCVSGSAQDGSAAYTYTPNPGGSTSLYRKSRKTGQWVPGSINPETGRFKKYDSGRGLAIGKRERYYDPTF